jgi:hypothetical protein
MGFKGIGVGYKQAYKKKWCIQAFKDGCTTNSKRGLSYENPLSIM